MSKSSKLGKFTIFNIILFGFMGQVAWAVENNFFNTFLFNEIGGNSADIANMVAASSVIAVFTTLIMGTLSDKVNRRKIFINFGYIIWGFTVMIFGFISRENVGKVLGISSTEALAATVSFVIIMDCVMTFFGSTSNDAAFNAWITDITDKSNRAKTEGILALLPVAALVIVTAAFTALAPKFGYKWCFIGLGILVSICGVIGLFTIKDSLTGEKRDTHFFSELIYGFRPSVIKNNKALYLSLVCFGIFSTAVQVFMPYLFIYVQRYLGPGLENFKVEIPQVIPSVIIALIVAAAAVYMILAMDKTEKIPFAIPGIILFIAGLIAVYKADTNIIKFVTSAIVFLAGYALLIILFSAVIRDFTPVDKVGSFQGIRMIFGVMIPMMIGPRVGSYVTEHFSTTTYINDYNEILKVPTPHVYLATAAVAAITLIPLVFLLIEWKKEEKKANNLDAALPKLFAVTSATVFTLVPVVFIKKMKKKTEQFK